MSFKCAWCGEEILATDPPPTIPIRVEPFHFHRECAFRLIGGSAGHILKRCPCYGGSEEDPAGLSKRAAAQAAYDAYFARQAALS